MEHLLNVSKLEPPEPMEQILDTLAAMPEGDRLRVLHRREPFPLYEILAKMGYNWEMKPGELTEYEIRIWRVPTPAQEIG